MKTELQDLLQEAVKRLNKNSEDIKYIDLSKYTDLKYLDLSYNALTTIDLSKQVNLIEADLRCDNLTKVILSKKVEYDVEIHCDDEIEIIYN